MFGAIFCAAAMIGVLIAARRSRGAAVAVLLTVGYAYGILRARFLDGASHFAFDAGLLALYAHELAKEQDEKIQARTRTLKKWLIVLMAWPVVCVLYSPFVDSQYVLIQVVGLRAAIFMLPAALIGARLTQEDVEVIGRCLACLNIVALVFALLEMRYGVASFFPENSASSIIYASRDVGEDMEFRLPSTFSSAHAYGGTMLMSLPFVVEILQRGKSKVETFVACLGLAAGLVGIFASAARQPVAQLAFAATVILLTTRPSLKSLVTFAVFAVVVWFIIASTERFQRFMTLSDAEFVQERIGNSVNKSFLDVVEDYPLGAGLGSAVGTSIPFFLLSYAKAPIGLESEYGRIALEQGIVGLLLWTTFLVWALWPTSKTAPSLSPLARKAAWPALIGAWGSAVIGVGLLTSIPGTVLVMLFIGLLNAAPAKEPSEAGRRAVAATRPGARSLPSAS